MNFLVDAQLPPALARWITAPAVLNLVGQYYPASRIPVKTQYLVEGLFEEGEV